MPAGGRRSYGKRAVLTSRCLADSMSRARVSLLGQSKRDHVDFSIPLTSGPGVSVSDEVARLA